MTESIKALRPRRFHWKDKAEMGDHEELGFIAQEVGKFSQLLSLFILLKMNLRSWVLGLTTSSPLSLSSPGVD